MSKLTYEERTKWFNEARFGMFIHWGLCSLLERGEWVMFAERIPAKESAKLADRFNPKKFDADRWVSIAREAGMKYVVLTTRHHEGFCLFDSKVSNFTSVKTAAKRDFVAEYVKAGRKAGMKVGFYYSLLDWRFPGYFNRQKYPESFEAMVEQTHSQVKELMTNYGQIDYLFYDGEWIPGVPSPREMYDGKITSSGAAKLWRSKELNAMVRKLQPEIIINNRSAVPEDVDTPEQAVGPSKAGRCWESCMTIGDYCGWGYIKNNPNMKTTTQLIQYLVHAASGCGNYLLNIGPRADGTVRNEEIERLREIGRWMKVNGDSIYGSERPPVVKGGFSAGIIGIMTAKGNKIYIHAFRWPGETAVVPGIKNKVLSARILATGKEAKVEQRPDGRMFLKDLPKEPPDRYDTVIALELDGEPKAHNFEHVPL